MDIHLDTYIIFFFSPPLWADETPVIFCFVMLAERHQSTVQNAPCDRNMIYDKDDDVCLGPNSISNLARKLGLVVYLMDSSVSVDTVLVNICYLFNGLQNK